MSAQSPQDIVNAFASLKMLGLAWQRMVPSCTSAFEVSFGSHVLLPMLPSGQLFASLALSAQLLLKAAGLFRLKLLRLSPLARGVVGPAVSKRRSTLAHLLQAWTAAVAAVPATLKEYHHKMALDKRDSTSMKASGATQN